MQRVLSVIYICLLLLALITIGIIYYNIANFNPENVVLERINNLESKIDSIANKKDSIRTIIDSTHIKIITNEKHYQERINTIVNQPSSADSQFITDYIGFYAKQNSLFDTK